MNGIYERITKLCNEKEISGYKLAKDLGMRPSFLTDLKAGRQKGLSAAKANAVAKYLGVTVSYLLTGEEEKPATITGDGSVDEETFKRKELANSLFANLSPEDQELALNVLRKLSQSQ